MNQFSMNATIAQQQQQKTGQINYRPIERQSLQENERKTPTLRNSKAANDTILIHWACVVCM